MCNNDFIANLLVSLSASERILKISQHSAKLWATAQLSVRLLQLTVYQTRPPCVMSCTSCLLHAPVTDLFESTALHLELSVFSHHVIICTTVRIAGHKTATNIQSSDSRQSCTNIEMNLAWRNQPLLTQVCASVKPVKLNITIFLKNIIVAQWYIFL